MEPEKPHMQFLASRSVEETSLLGAISQALGFPISCMAKQIDDTPAFAYFTEHEQKYPLSVFISLPNALSQAEQQLILSKIAKEMDISFLLQTDDDDIWNLIAQDGEMRPCKVVYTREGLNLDE